MKWTFVAIAVVVGAFGLLALMAIGPGGRDVPDAAAAQEAARNWTSWDETDPPRREGDGWEVDVRRGDGSVVEVNLGPELELLELDEEVGPGGGLAYDEVLGQLRERAILAARPHAGGGHVRSVEREEDGAFEVDVLRPDGKMVEVDLDGRLKFAGLEYEERGDE
jgi:hypothetical protein